MIHFEYDRQDDKAELYELLNNLIENWENEVVEFKEASSQYSPEKIGQYFSALSNEANLADQRCGWLVFGVRDSDRAITGTSFKKGDRLLLEKFKYEISRDTTDGITFFDIVELFPVVNSETKRVLMFQIPAAARGIPTAWKHRCYARAGESLVPLPQYKVDLIRSQDPWEWSAKVIPNSGVEHLDPQAVAIARQGYKERMDRPHISEEVDSLTDEEFLTKLKLMVNGNLTNAALLLLGRPEHDNLFPVAPLAMWRLMDREGQIRDYEIFEIPFITLVDRMLEKVRYLTYRYIPKKKTVDVVEIQQYDEWILRELLNNCIAHSIYYTGGRIYLDEFENDIYITNPGVLFPEDIPKILSPGYFPASYRNPLLARSMGNFRMIDTASSGIKKIFRLLRGRYFPMPDYEMVDGSRVRVRVYGETINDRFTHILHDNPDLDLNVVYLLDQVQKKKYIPPEDVQRLVDMQYLRIVGNNMFLVDDINEEVFDDTRRNTSQEQKYSDDELKNLIVIYIQDNGKARRKDLKALLWNKLPEHLTEQQKNTKISSLLDALKDKKMIKTENSNRRSAFWILNKTAESEE